MDQLRASWKWALSFTKKRSSWNLDDYPIHFRQQTAEDTLPWAAQIVNWWQPVGLGHSREEAFKNLVDRLETIRDQGDLPRPGTRVPIEFADSAHIESHWGIVSRILKDVMDYDPEDVLVITDESSLYDFTMGESISLYQDRIYEEFKVDVSDIKSGNFIEIAKRIQDGA